MKRFMLVLTAAAALSAGIAALAIAKGDSFKDPKGDNKCCGKSFDFVKASARTSGSDLKFTAKVKGKAASKSLPFLLINPHGSKGCDFRIGPVNGDPAVANCNTNEVTPAERVGTSGSKGFKYVFSRDSIGNPSKLKWQFVYTEGEYGAGVIDKAPNKAKKFSP